MEQNAHFSTRTDQRWYVAWTAAISLAMDIFAGIIMWLCLGRAAPALFVFGICLFCTVLFCLFLFRQKNIPLHFYGNVLQVFHLDGQIYTFEAIPGFSFRFYQNALERQYNVGRIKVKGTTLYFYGVQNYAETCAYIQQNFPDS